MRYVMCELQTGSQDIRLAVQAVTLWVARMVIAGMYNLGDLPFEHCFIHANILDGKGEMMRKSAGNGIDPVDII
jgi:valyl-tRNA synthetase